MYGILSDIIYWLNSNKLSFLMALQLHKNIYFCIFSWDLSLFSVLKEWRQSNQ